MCLPSAKSRDRAGHRSERAQGMRRDDGFGVKYRLLRRRTQLSARRGQRRRALRAAPRLNRPRLQRDYRCISISLSIDIMFALRFAMMIMEPKTIRPTTKIPKASARKLLV